MALGLKSTHPYQVTGREGGANYSLSSGHSARVETLREKIDRSVPFSRSFTTALERALPVCLGLRMAEEGADTAVPATRYRKAR